MARILAVALVLAAVGCGENGSTGGLTAPRDVASTGGAGGSGGTGATGGSASTSTSSTTATPTGTTSPNPAVTDPASPTASPTASSPAGGAGAAASSAAVLPITVRYLGTPAPAVQAVMQRVVARWQAVIAAGGGLTRVAIAAGACFAGSPAIDETVSGLVLYVRSAPLDGQYNVLAQAGPCALRQAGRGLPVVASITFDTDDVAWLATSGERLYSTALHETGHALGLGTLWPIQQPLLATGLGTPDPMFTGASARAAFAAIGGASVSAAGVPIEGTAGRGPDGHWRMSTFGAEVMVGVLQGDAAAPLSAVTVGALADMGYQVRPTAADAYALPAAGAAMLLPSISAHDAGLAAGDVVEPPRLRVDAATGRATPLATVRRPADAR